VTAHAGYANRCAKEMNVEMKVRFTQKQGQYLAFIYNYSKIHGRAPAEADLERYFKTTPPTIHQMILKLEKKGLISRVPGQPRSIQLLISREELPILK
jgi:DNA-binding MarR family transcriptional regulator